MLTPRANMNAPIRDAFDCSSRKPMRRHFVSGLEFGNGICLPTEHLKSVQELVQPASVQSGSNWNLAVLVFEERGKPEYPEKNLSEQGDNQQHTQPTYGAGTGNRTRATFVGGECSHHCATPAPQGSALPKSREELWG